MSVRRISENDVHNITSGQVITDLSNIVKELIENAIDANSNSINITFKRFGLEGIEIQDNGDGISIDDFENLCKKNFTSKLENFENLINVKTLGFRGEALNSICNISQIVITTAKSKDAPKGWELNFNKDGELIDKKLINHSKGTLIKVTDLFKNLPVRKLNLEKNYKKEFQKCLQLLTSYLLILTNIRIIIYNIDISGKKKIMMKTTNNSLIKDNIINIFGSTGLQGLEDVKYDLNLDDSYTVSLNGLLSDSSIGNGRLSKDRQFLFINKRPIEFKKIIKLINSIYKKFNYLQYPMILLNFEIHEHLLDINVTPDKKTVLLSNKYENILLGKLETFLENFWDKAGTYNIPVNENYQDKIKERNQNILQPKLESFALFQENTNIDFNDQEVEVIERTAVRNSKVVVMQMDDNDDDDYNESNDVETNEGDDQDDDDNDDKSDYNEDCNDDNNKNYDESDNEILHDEKRDGENNQEPETEIKDYSMNESSDVLEGCFESNNSDLNNESNNFSLQKNDEISILSDVSHKSCDCDKESHEQILDSLFINDSLLDSKDSDLEKSKTSDFNDENTEKSVNVINQKIRIRDDELVPKKNKRMKYLNGSSVNTNNIETSDISDQILSEKILGLSIHKDDFINMKIVGQFNKGFIIVYKKDSNDILIIDQHASDEKYNFEKFIEETTFENQPLVISQKLDLNSMEKLTILNHLQIFEKNGFKFKTKVNDHIESIDNNDDEVENLKQEDLYLTSLPYSRNTIFDLKDLDELIQLVEDMASTTNSMPRPSKVRSMFAMRACRSSIMIGQSLNKPKMENIVQHLSTLDKPWNCPHGRPTMRHLVKIDQWKPFNKDYQY